MLGVTMADKEKSVGEYILVVGIIAIVAAIAAVFLANFVFVTWQNVPMSLYSYNTISVYNDAYGEFPKVKTAIQGSIGAGVVAWIALMALVMVAIFGKPKRELHGSAKFADMMDVRKTGFILTPKQQKEKFAKKPSNPSILVGKYKGKLLEFFGNEFTFVAAPTRSGKGVGIVIPNLLHYRDSVVVLDVKNENWDITAGFRSKYQECYLFAPKAEDECSHRYNPLDYIDRSEKKRMGDIQNIANIMYPADGQDAFWQNAAQRLFSGLVLYMLETTNRPCTMAELIKLATPNKPLNEWIEDTIIARAGRKADPENGVEAIEPMLISVFYKDGLEQPFTEDRKGLEERKEKRPLSVECVEALMSFAGNASENTRAGILASMISPLNIFTDPMVAAATSASDFRLDEVRKKKMSIFVGIQPNELARFDKLLNLFFSQLINLNTRVLPEQDPSLKYQCLVLLDEFTALGKVDIINKAVAYIAGYNMRLMLIFQNKSQCEQYYTKEGTQTMLSNMACQIIFAPRTIDDAKSYSELLGTETVKGKSVSRNKGGKGGGGGSVSTSDQSRALMLPQELKELDQSKEIVLYNAEKPILADKIRYFKDPIFMERANQKIADRCMPKKLNVDAMLEVMRGVIQEEITDVSQLPSGKEMVEDPRWNAFFDEFNAMLGFDADFFNTP